MELSMVVANVAMGSNLVSGLIQITPLDVGVVTTGLLSCYYSKQPSYYIPQDKLHMQLTKVWYREDLQTSITNLANLELLHKPAAFLCNVLISFPTEASVTVMPFLKRVRAMEHMSSVQWKGSTYIQQKIPLNPPKVSPTDY